MKQHAVRMTVATWERAEALVPWLSTLHGANRTTSDVMREALMRGLASLERESKVVP
jgi:hypothetical protein